MGTFAETFAGVFVSLFVGPFAKAFNLTEDIGSEEGLGSTAGSIIDTEDALDCAMGCVVIVSFTEALGGLEGFECPGHCAISLPKCTTGFLARIDRRSVRSSITDDV